MIHLPTPHGAAKAARSSRSSNLFREKWGQAAAGGGLRKDDCDTQFSAFWVPLFGSGLVWRWPALSGNGEGDIPEPDAVDGENVNIDGMEVE